ncbi:TIGR03086 family metal-binding protein [Actinopolymorpha sp. B11F2]|uniref:TIGR03086 family metal-binding protein n=1 Tax=Actinopolymorpha sp. B11F2 TaxID=3160862 RepID=UPI0032E3BC1B
MTDVCERAAAAGGIVLLERAINYTLGSLHLVGAGELSRPTPCDDWDLGSLLAHLDDSLVALFEAVDGGQMAPGRTSPPVGRRAGRMHSDRGPADFVNDVRARARDLVGACTIAGRHEVSVAGLPLSTGIVTGAGAIEVAVHGWDVARGCGWERPIPASLAEEMLALSPLFVATADRQGLFAPPVTPPEPASPSDRLVAFLGRQP